LTDFYGVGELMWHRLFGSNAVGCCSRADAVIDFFAAYSSTVTHHTFQWAGQLPKLHLSLLGSGPQLTKRFLQPTSVYPPICISIGSAVFARLSNVSERLSDTQTDHATPSVAINCIDADYIIEEACSSSITSFWLKVTSCDSHTSFMLCVHFSGRILFMRTNRNKLQSGR